MKYGVSHIVDKADTPVCRLWRKKMEKAKQNQKEAELYVKEFARIDMRCDRCLQNQYATLIESLDHADVEVKELLEESCCEYHHKYYK